MQQRPRGGATLAAIVLLAGIAFAAANVAASLMMIYGTVQVPPPADFYQHCLPCIVYLVAAPLVLAVLLIPLAARRTEPSAQRGTRVADREREEPAGGAASPASALQLLGLLQQEGRFVDFVEEDIDAYSDAQVGAAVRSIHAGCRKALSSRIELQRIFAVEDGSDVVIEPGFDPASVRLTGNVTGQPPFHGTLQHGGWRATTVSLPQSPGGADCSIIAPAEVEIP
ncbi:MAG: DUF2760 domain-containing protein [Candidatus Binatia bacterium]